MKEVGTLTLFIGNMFSNKTGSLMRKITALREFGQKKILVVKPDKDTRSGKNLIKDFHGDTMEAFEITSESPSTIFPLIEEQERIHGRRFDIIAFDEVQFFSNSFFVIIRRLIFQGYDVLAAGLPLDFRGEPFGTTLSLIGLCQNNNHLIWCTSYCAKCGVPAKYPQRILSNGAPAPYREEQTLVGGKDTYEARCETCYELPDAPLIQ